MVPQGKVVEARFIERGPVDVILLGPVGLVNDASWILQASYTRVNASHAPNNDTSGQDVTAVLRKLIAGAAVAFIPGSVSLTAMFGG